MDRLEAALKRFSAALALLESRLAAASGGASDADTAAEVTSLTREREHLLSRIALLEEESSSLAGLTEAVEVRLDGAIAEIRSVLGRN